MKKVKRISALILLMIILLTSFTNLAFAEVKADKLNQVIEDTGKFIYSELPSPKIGSIGGEWAVIGLARSKMDIPREYYENYYKAVEDYVKSLDGVLHDKKYTEYSRLIISLTAIGKDPKNVAGYDLLRPLGDYDNTVWQGINGPIWALIALDSGDYPMPKNPEAKTQATRDMYVDRILDYQLSDGGWSLLGSSEKDGVSDPDITGMALQALAKYQDLAKVKKASEEALECLSKLQKPNGGYTSWGSENSESCVQVIVALTELGISLEDPRFVKNDFTLLDNLMTFYRENKGFLHTEDGYGSSQMATEQGFYALVAAKRARDGRPSLYKMTDPLSLEISKDDIESTKALGLENKHKDIRVNSLVKPGASFSDIAGKNQVAIEGLAERNIIAGKSESEFKPEENMTRAEFATIVVKALGFEPIGESSFQDVKEGSWYYGYVAAANKYGIVKGKAENKFEANGKITREEAGVMVARAAELTGMKNLYDESNSKDVLAQFEDYMKLGDWSRSSMAFLYDQEILDSSQMKIEPRLEVTRGQVAQMIFNMLEKSKLI